MFTKVTCVVGNIINIAVQVCVAFGVLVPVCVHVWHLLSTCCTVCKLPWATAIVLLQPNVYYIGVALVGSEVLKLNVTRWTEDL